MGRKSHSSFKSVLCLLGHGLGMPKPNTGIKVSRFRIFETSVLSALPIYISHSLSELVSRHLF